MLKFPIVIKSREEEKVLQQRLSKLENLLEEEKSKNKILLRENLMLHGESYLKDRTIETNLKKLHIYEKEAKKALIDLRHKGKTKRLKKKKEKQLYNILLKNMEVLK